MKHCQAMLKYLIGNGCAHASTPRLQQRCLETAPCHHATAMRWYAGALLQIKAAPADGVQKMEVIMSDSKQQLLDNVNAIVGELENSDTDPAEWLNEQLNIEVIMRDTSGQFVGAEVLCAFGGPDIRVDTRWDRVEGNWGGDHFSMHYDDKCGLNDLLEETSD